VNPHEQPTRDFDVCGSFEKPEKALASTKKTMELLEVEKILQGNKCVNLLHRGEVYRLQVTRQGKLLLTK
jgi:hemin uptake protein HemP